MGQQHNPNSPNSKNMNDERTKKAQQDREQKHGMPGTFKNDPDAKPEKSKSPDNLRH